MTLKLYDVNEERSISLRSTRQFLQDLNILMASYKLSMSDIIRGSVSAQADYVRQRMAERLAEEGK